MNYRNPVHGKLGVFGANYPEYMTKEELISFCSESAVGTSKGLAQDFESTIKWLEGETGEKVGFEFDDLSYEELLIVDDIVFSCDHCGWNCSTDEKNDIDGESVCNDCASGLRESENCHEYDDDDILELSVDDFDE